MYLVGITGLMDSGKSTFALKLNKYLNSEILSIDDLLIEADDLIADKMEATSDLTEKLSLGLDENLPRKIVAELLKTRAKEISDRGSIVIIEGSILAKLDIWKRCDKTIMMQADNKARAKNSKMAEAFENGNVILIGSRNSTEHATYEQTDKAAKNDRLFLGVTADITVKNNYDDITFEREALRVARIINFAAQRKMKKQGINQDYSKPINSSNCNGLAKKL